MSKIALVTDSTAYLPADLVERYGIHVVPVRVIWEGKTYRDGVDITAEEVYALLKERKTLPTTSQPPAQDFVDLFRRLHEEGKEILGIFIAKVLSGTIDSARQAQQMVPEARIEIVDSHATMMDLGFQVLAVARALEANPDMTLEEAKALAEQARNYTGLVFMVDTLEYLHRGGRIGGAARWVGTLLNLKPLLTLNEQGVITPIERVRTRKKALARMLDLLEERIGDRRPLRLATMHVAAEEEARKLLERARERFQPDEMLLTGASPAVGVHIGPGGLGLAYMVGM